MVNKKKNASNLAYEALKNMIYQYQLIPGQKVTYGQLSQKIKLSKTPIINALTRLEQEEFVISIRNKGFFIKELNIDEVAELFKIREALELLAVEEGIRHQNPKGLKKIKKTMIDHREYNTDKPTRDRLVLDAMFHLSIAEMGRNRNLFKLLKHIFEHIFLRHRLDGIPYKRINEATREHQEIFDAICERNIAKAKKYISFHIQGGQNYTIERIAGSQKGIKIWPR
jgi:DNA-binding GntR family transcriptional regulator